MPTSIEHQEKVQSIEVTAGIVTSTYELYKDRLERCRQIINTHKLQQTVPSKSNMPSPAYPIALAALIGSALADIHNVNLPSNFFDGPQSGIGSWYRASAGQDSTNGKSWCAYTYYNSDPVFAVVGNNPFQDLWNCH